MNVRATHGGFTLLEVLVVVAIGAILAAMVVLRLGQWGSPDDPAAQLERFGALLESQCQQAVFQARPRGLRVTDHGYDFWQATASGWVALRGDGLDRPRAWTGAVAPALLLGGHEARLSATVEAPQIVCQPLGELTLFELTLAKDQQRWRVNGRGDGRLVYHWPR